VNQNPSIYRFSADSPSNLLTNIFAVHQSKRSVHRIWSHAWSNRMRYRSLLVWVLIAAVLADAAGWWWYSRLPSVMAVVARRGS
jgi:hypothetical protein